MRLSSQIRHYQPADVLQAPWMMERYEPAQYRDILARLTPRTFWSPWWIRNPRSKHPV